MKIKFTSFLAALIFIACSKENLSEKVTSTEQSNYQSPDDVPLNDLGANLYRGYVGGLYPGGLNVPTGTYASDLLATSTSIIPIDTLGAPNATKGYIVFLSMGGSTGGKNMTALI